MNEVSGIGDPTKTEVADVDEAKKVIEQKIVLEDGMALGSHRQEVKIGGVDYLVSVGNSMDFADRLVPSIIIAPYLEGTRKPDIDQMVTKNVLLRERDDAGRVSLVRLEQKSENMETFNELCEEILEQVIRGVQVSGIEETLAAYDR